MLRNTRICVEKLPPENEQKLHKRGLSPSNMSRLKAAFLKDKIWPSNSVLRIAFINGNNNGGEVNWTPLAVLKQEERPLDPLETELRDKDLTPQEIVKRVIIERFVPIIGLGIEFVDDPRNANVRVSFDPSDGAWAYVGTDQLESRNPEEATVNLGWLDIGTIIHEFCHVLGMIHEHQNPRGKNIDWNKERVYEYMERTQGWDKETTDANVLNQYDMTQLNGSEFDPLSVMLYFFSPDLTKNEEGTEQNMRYSPLDVIWLNKMYNENAMKTPEEFYQEVYKMDIEDVIDNSYNNTDEEDDQEEKSNTNSLYILLVVVIVVLIIAGIWWYSGKTKNTKKSNRYY